MSFWRMLARAPRERAARRSAPDRDPDGEADCAGASHAPTVLCACTVLH